MDKDHQLTRRNTSGFVVNVQGRPKKEPLKIFWTIMLRCVQFNNYLYLPRHRTRLYVQKAKLCRWTKRWYQDRHGTTIQWTHNFRVKCGSPFTRDICRYVPTDNAWILGGWMACLNCCCCCGCSLPFAAAGCIHLLLAGPAYL